MSNLDLPRMIREAETKAAEAEKAALEAKAVLDYLRSLAERYPESSGNGASTPRRRRRNGPMSLSQGIRRALGQAGPVGLSPAEIRQWMQERGAVVNAKSLSAQLQRMKGSHVHRVGDGRWVLAKYAKAKIEGGVGQ